MANTIQIKGGAKASLPTLNAREFGFATDTYELFIGKGASNLEILTKNYVIDEDDMASNLDTKVPTQQSVKAYVDAGGSGDVTAAANITDNAVVAGDGGAKGVQGRTVLISDNGEMTNPSQPAFLAYNSVTDANVTGDNTLVTVEFDTERYDQGGNFDGTSTFTAPVSGRYLFCASIILDDMDLDTYEEIKIYLVTSNMSYKSGYDKGTYDTLGQRSLVINALVDMDANDTVTTQVRARGGAKTVDIFGGGEGFTYFSGALFC